MLLNNLMKPAGTLKMIYKLISFVFIAFINLTHAADIEGMGSVNYQNFNDKVKQETTDKAIQSALKKYVSTFDNAKKKNYFKFKNQIESRKNDFIVETNIVQDKNDKDKRNYKVIVRIQIDDGLIDNILADLSAAGNQALGEASNFGNILIARFVSSAKEYKARKVDVKEKEIESSLNESVDETDSDYSESVKQRSIEKTSEGGSVQRKRSQNNYATDLTVQESLDAIMSEELINAGFEPLDYSELSDYGAPFIDEMDDYLSSKSTISGKLKKQILDAAIEAGWQYVGLGVVSIDAPLDDDSTGLRKIAAKVNYTVYMVDGDKAKRVGAVRSTQVFGLGETDEYAETEALNSAAEKAISEVISQLQNKGVR